MVYTDEGSRAHVRAEQALALGGCRRLSPVIPRLQLCVIVVIVDVVIVARRGRRHTVWQPTFSAALLKRHADENDSIDDATNEETRP